MAAEGLLIILLNYKHRIARHKYDNGIIPGYEFEVELYKNAPLPPKPTPLVLNEKEKLLLRKI